MARAIAACPVPVISAVGHETDFTIADFVADVRASTPTDAGKLIVPDAAAERDRVVGLRGRARLAVRQRLDAERRVLVAHRTRAVMTDPLALLAPHRAQLATLRGRATDRLVARLEREGDWIGHLRAQVRALSPQSTLDRGYAVVTHPDGRVVRDREDVAPDELLRVLVARGDFGVRVIGHESPPKHAAPS